MSNGNMPGATVECETTKGTPQTRRLNTLLYGLFKSRSAAFVKRLVLVLPKFRDCGWAGPATADREPAKASGRALRKARSHGERTRGSSNQGLGTRLS